MRPISIVTIAILLTTSGWPASLSATEAKGDNKGRTPAPNYSRVNVKGIVAAIEPGHDALFLEMPNGIQSRYSVPDSARITKDGITFRLGEIEKGDRVTLVQDAGGRITDVIVED